MWDLSSPTRNRTCVPCIGKWILNQWTTREVPRITFFYRSLMLKYSPICTLLSLMKNFFWYLVKGNFSNRLLLYMKVYYYHVCIIKTYHLGFFFLPLRKAKRETLATSTTLKWTPGMSPAAWPFATKSSNQNFMVFCSKVQATIIG